MTNITFRELIKIFINFLKQNNAYKEYLKETRKFLLKTYSIENKHNLINPLTTQKLKKQVLFNNCYNIIDYSIHWAETPQGHDFWEVLNYEWNAIVSGKKFNIIGENIKAKTKI